MTLKVDANFKGKLTCGLKSLFTDHHLIVTKTVFSKTLSNITRKYAIVFFVRDLDTNILDILDSLDITDILDSKNYLSDILHYSDSLSLSIVTLGVTYVKSLVGCSVDVMLTSR